MEISCGNEIFGTGGLQMSLVGELFSIKLRELPLNREMAQAEELPETKEMPKIEKTELNAQYRPRMAARQIMHEPGRKRFIGLKNKAYKRIKAGMLILGIF